MSGRRLSARYSASLPLELFCRGFHRCNRRFPDSVHSSMMIHSLKRQKFVDGRNRASGKHDQRQSRNMVSSHASTPARALRPAYARSLDRRRHPSPCSALPALSRQARVRKECCRGRAARLPRPSRDRHPCAGAGGIGVTSRSVPVDSAERTRTTTAVMLSLPPLPFASWINASTIRSGLARDTSSC